MPSTPEEAARGGTPEQYARALAVEISPDGRHAAVLLGTNEEPYLYPYVVMCERVGGEWVEGSSGSAGLNWFSTTHHAEPKNLGALMYTGEGPSDATAVTVRWHGVKRTVLVSRGYFFVAEWNIPPPERGGEPPVILSFTR